ncbi:MAG: hypothetical protein NTW61_06165 [Candidatus Melainabacteria bacterium]|nr:hypothetical protein [Candidatus Melainabacteria bacterium]
MMCFPSIVVPSFSWLVCQGTAVWQPPDTLFNYFWTNSGASPYGKTALNATPLCHQTGIDGGMFFLPLRWTERIGSCRANAMVVPTGWFERLRYLNF